jgi:hypothetical protein
MTLIDPVVVSVLRDQGEEAGYAEMEAQYQRFMGSLPDQTKAARVFVEHWSGKGAWELDWGTRALGDHVAGPEAPARDDWSPV